MNILFYKTKHLVSNELIWNIRWLPIVQIIQVWNEESLASIWLNLNYISMLPLSSSAPYNCWVPFFNNMSHVAIIESHSPSKCTFYYYMRFFKKWTKTASLFFYFSGKLPFIQSSLYKLYVLLLFFYVYNFNDGKRNLREQLYSSVTLHPEAYT